MSGIVCRLVRSWGFNLFCVNFCESLPRGRSIHPFCSKVKRDPLQTECTDDRNSVALCNLIRHEFPLPKEYQVRQGIPTYKWRWGHRSRDLMFRVIFAELWQHRSRSQGPGGLLRRVSVAGRPLSVHPGVYVAQQKHHRAWIPVPVWG